MDKKELFDTFDGFSQNLMVALAEINAVKHQFQEILEQNVSLRLENDKLRQRLAEFEASPRSSQSSGKSNLETIYEDGFHICTTFYGQRRENSSECVFCMELLDRE